MPIGYVITVAMLAFCTTVAVIGPRPPHSTPSSWSYWATFHINELPFLALAFLTASTVLAFVEGDIDSPGGWAAFAVAVLTAAGLFLLIRRALAARPALRKTLQSAGIDFPAGRRPWAHILFAPLHVRRRDVIRISHISYGGSGRGHLLDVHHRRDRPEGAPVLVFWHGGGFRSGDKNRENRAFLQHLAAQGWVCVSANYRLAPEADYSDHLADARSAVAWVRSHGAEYGADPRTLIVSGSSAGAHLAATVAITDATISAAIGFYGYYGDVKPSSAVPPFLLLHGVNDSCTLIEDARDFAARLGSNALFAELPGAQHSFDLFYSIRYSDVIRAATAFCTTVHERLSSRP